MSRNTPTVSMDGAKPISTPLGVHFKISTKQSRNSEELEEMMRVPYVSVVGSLMYVMVCTRPNIAHIVGVVSRFMKNLG